MAAGVAVGAAVATTGTTGPDKAAATHLLRASLAAAEKAGSFHYVASSVSSTPFNPSSSPVSQVTVGDAGVLGGRQMITIAKHTFDVIVTGTTAFFEGDADAMVDELGVPTSVAHSYAGRWISLVPGDTPYQSVEVAVTTSSALQQNVTFTANEEIPTAKIDGEPVIGLRGPMGKQQGQVAKGTATLYVAARGKHLPVRYVEQGTVGTGQQASKFEFSLAFSAWGEAVSTTAPAGAVAFSSLEASGPSGPTIIT